MTVFAAGRHHGSGVERGMAHQHGVRGGQPLQHAAAGEAMPDGKFLLLLLLGFCRVYRGQPLSRYDTLLQVRAPY